MENGFVRGSMKRASFTLFLRKKRTPIPQSPLVTAPQEAKMGKEEEFQFERRRHIRRQPDVNDRDTIACARRIYYFEGDGGFPQDKALLNRLRREKVLRRVVFYMGGLRNDLSFGSSTR
ncbi:hypothetical protein PFISCL1PPCAC_28227 [Pristionchus fissidentatus]|uniref:Uncharacterized protein n=1 Tax=Pristionchus fissidentatus TaxID=1538716 RepID=A0AAV5X1R8_9BILA|nr:hypothetical protein PFISCL1PPCAC_28227 [Pristionchus fissidentatus]